MSQEDHAQDLELKLWEQNNAVRPMAANYAPTDRGYGPEYCESCDDPMPPIRRAMGASLCTSCKSIQERASNRRL